MSSDTSFDNMNDDDESKQNIQSQPQVMCNHEVLGDQSSSNASMHDNTNINLVNQCVGDSSLHSSTSADVELTHNVTDKEETPTNEILKLNDDSSVDGSTVNDIVLVEHEQNISSKKVLDQTPSVRLREPQESTALNTNANESDDEEAAFDLLPRDRFGFVIEAPSSSSMAASSRRPNTPDEEEARLQNIRLDNKRLLKWSRMLSNDRAFFHRNPSVVKRRIRKGIPDSVRGVVWKLLAQSEAFARKHQKGLYQKLLAKRSTTWEAQINRDVHRTFPKHVFFRQRKGIGQSSLFNVLKVYAIYDEELGYCQGMGFLVGLFLMNMGEEDSFWMLVMLMKGSYNMRGLYCQGMPLVNMRCYQLKRLLERRHPKLISHLEHENVDIMTLTMQWFITNFSYNLPFRVLLRIWDIYLLEQSPKILFRVSIFFFEMNHSAIIKSNFERIMMLMKESHSDLDPETVIRGALNVRLKSKELKDLERDYQKLNAPR